MLLTFRSFFAAGALLALVASAGAQSAGPSIVIDAATGAVLSEENASAAWHPASTTKMMTAYVALRAVRQGRIGLETAIPASRLAASQPRVKVYIKPGQEITLDNALKVMMVKSANDIAYVIAEGVAGDVDSFVAMMNAEARRLGMRDTVFRNPNGWHHPEQQSSARDLAVLAMTMLREFPEYEEYWGIGAVQLGKAVLNNTNGLIGRYSGASGFKTGFVCASGFNVVATANRGGRTLIAVVLGAYSGAERTVRAAQLLDAGFASWGGGGRTVASIPASGGTARSICAEVRAFGRGAPLADDVETSGPISFALQGGGAEGGDMYAGLNVGRGSAVPARSGRVTLGPRAQFAPLQIAYGRTPGSARAPLAANVAGARATQTAGAADQAPGSAAAAARRGAPAANGAIAVAPGAAVLGTAAAFAPPGQRPAAAETPIRLHGAIGGAPAALRPSSAAGIRPPAAPPRQAAAPAGQRQAPAALTAPSRAADPARPAARPASAKPAAARPASAKPAARPAAARPAAANPATAAPAARPAARAAPAQPPRRPEA